MHIKRIALKFFFIFTCAISPPCYAVDVYKGFLYQISRESKNGNELHYIWGVSHFIKAQEYSLTEKLDQAYLDSAIYMPEFNFHLAENKTNESDHYQVDEIEFSQSMQTAQERLAEFLKNRKIPKTVIEKIMKLRSFSMYLELQIQIGSKFDWPQFALGFDTRKIQQSHAGLLRIDFLETKNDLISAWEKACSSPEDRQRLMLGLASDEFYEAMFLSAPKTLEYVANGDVDGFTKLEQELIEKYPPHHSFYKCSILPRNITWADKIDRLENKDETIFVTVGAGHLFGKDNFLDQLKSRGFKVEFIEQEK
jgi:uncharacterized protein